ncbi:rho guanine nucleotide exchange factor TIAM2-like, partial [Aulostomus maculatus]
WQYEHASDGVRGGTDPTDGAPPRYRSPFGAGNSESGGSPKVLLSKDGSMRVEFSNARVMPVETQGHAAIPATAPAEEPSLRTSKGSSFSSEDSWYDSPWGNAIELVDSVFTCGESVDDSSGYATYSSTHTVETGASHTFFSAPADDVSPGLGSGALFTSTAQYTSCSTGRTEDSGIGDSVILQPERRDLSVTSVDSIYTGISPLPAFPTTPQSPRTASTSSTALDDVIMEEGSGGGGVQRYTSYTLPHCRAEPFSVASTAPPRNNRKDFLKSRIRQLSDWTGSLSRKKRRIQEPLSNEGFVNRPDASTLWSCNPLHAMNQNQNQKQLSLAPCVSTRSLNQNQSGDAQRQDIYQNFMHELEMGCSWTEPSEGDGDDYDDDNDDDGGDEEEEEEEMDGGRGGREELDIMMEKEQGVVRRVGRLSFKPLMTVNKDRKLELVARRRWRHYWVTLKGCSLLFYETYVKNGGAEHKLSPRYALMADDSIVQGVPEHPRREHVFCLSNAYGDVYLFQATNQTDLENWVTAIHSASAAQQARRQGKDNTLRFLRCQSRSLLHKIDIDGKMKKMAELQLSIIKEHKSRKAVESQIQQWEQNLEKLNLDVFRLRCYLASLQGSELPNPKSLLAVASRPSKSMLGRLGVFSVSSFHALVCSRDEATLRGRRLSSAGNPRWRGLPYSLRTLDGPSGRCRHQRQACVTRLREVAPSAGSPPALHVPGEQRISDVAVFTLQVCRQDAAQELDSSPDDDVPPPFFNDVMARICGGSEQNVNRVCSLYQTFPEGRAVAVEVPQNPYGKEARLQPTSPAHLSVCQRLRKVIEELVDTEKSYVKDLVCLFDIYLTPLQAETFLSRDEMEALFGSLPEMLDFQRVFLQTLEDRIASCPNLSRLKTPEQFKKLLVSLGGSFLYYADHFKLYSGFCANHIKVQKVLERAKTDGAFKQFLEARNPTNQHSSTLESYLIKPVQRVLKYPLLLRELVSLTDAESPEHTHLTEALRAMERVASHINEMQKIYEDYGAVFEQLVAEQSATDKQVTEILMGEFLVHSSAVWLNPLPCLGRLRKEPELTLFVFKRAVILVYRDTSKLKKKMSGAYSADPDPFRFRWLIPVSAVQVRAAGITGSERSCVWELVHCRSEVEGRPETVFQLCSRGLETKASVLRVLRCLLRDRVPAGSWRTDRMSRAYGGDPWRRRQERRCLSDSQRRFHRLPDKTCRSILGETCSEPLLPSHTAAGKKSRLCSLTSDLEAQLQSLSFSEEDVDPRRDSKKRQSPGAGDSLDLSGVLEREFSVQSMTSMINEDCFYDAMLGLQKTVVPTLQG